MTLWMGHSYYAVPIQLCTLNKNEQNMQVIGYVQTYGQAQAFKYFYHTM